MLRHLFVSLKFKTILFDADLKVGLQVQLIDLILYIFQINAGDLCQDIITTITLMVQQSTLGSADRIIISPY
jgi:hypothetical protein